LLRKIEYFVPKTDSGIVVELRHFKSP